MKQLGHTLLCGWLLVVTTTTPGQVLIVSLHDNFQLCTATASKLSQVFQREMQCLPMAEQVNKHTHLILEPETQ